jgi:hypothetical protein
MWSAQPRRPDGSTSGLKWQPDGLPKVTPERVNGCQTANKYPAKSRVQSLAHKASAASGMYVRSHARLLVQWPETEKEQSLEQHETLTQQEQIEADGGELLGAPERHDSRQKRH